jgi:hypothetical protein
MFRSCS